MSQVSPHSGVMLADDRAPPEIALSEEDREALKRAVEALEAPSFAARLSAVAGRPIELLGQAVPQAVSETASRATQVALRQALRYALTTIPKESAEPEARLHRALAALSGAMGGALGISAVLGIAGAPCFLGASVIKASVVTSTPATDAAPCSATRTTLAGSRIPASQQGRFRFQQRARAYLTQPALRDRC